MLSNMAGHQCFIKTVRASFSACPFAVSRGRAASWSTRSADVGPFGFRASRKAFSSKVALVQQLKFKIQEATATVKLDRLATDDQACMLNACRATHGTYNQVTGPKY